MELYPPSQLGLFWPVEGTDILDKKEKKIFWSEETVLLLPNHKLKCLIQFKPTEVCI